MKSKIAIVGAGVSGLMTGIRLLEAGYDVTLLARESEPQMASFHAPAMWTPYKASPEDKLIDWSKRSLSVYRDFCKQPDLATGVSERKIVEYHTTTDLPLWTQLLPDYTTFYTDLPSHCVVGYRYNIMFIDNPIFMDFLNKWFTQLNGKQLTADLKRLDDIDNQFEVIVNCSGVWSNQLVPDPKSFPIRGQYLITEKPPGLDQINFIMLDDKNYTLIVPRMNDCWIGGTTEDDNWDAQPDPNTTAAIFARVKQFAPEFCDVTITHVGIGLRPGRSEVRLKSAKLHDGRTVVHNYGHGGSGFTAGWGCASDVVTLVESA